MRRGPDRLLFDLTPLDTPSGPRGIGRYIRELALGLSELPHEALGGIELVGLTSLGWDGSSTITHDLAAFKGTPRDSLPTESEFYVWAYRQRLALWRAARRVGATAVHICDPHATPLFLGLAGVRKIVTCHDLVPTLFPDHYFDARDGGAFVGARIERRRYRSADLVVAISDATRRDVCTLLGMPPERVVRVHNGVDLARWEAPPLAEAAPVLARLGLEGCPFVLYVGGADWRKNAEGMIEGLARARAGGVDLDLAWAGPMSPGHTEAVRAAARQHGVAEHVRLLGFVPDDELGALYRSAVAHIIVSRAEGFGLTVVEAMASGCPVLTTRAGALAEVAGDAAITVDPEDPGAIAAALVRLVREPALRQDLILRGRARARQFSRRAQAEAMAGVYREFFSSLRGAR
jgi:glycosyltransferase involved in cell wall biosynthesis